MIPHSTTRRIESAGSAAPPFLAPALSSRGLRDWPVIGFLAQLIEVQPPEGDRPPHVSVERRSGSPQPAIARFRFTRKRARHFRARPQFRLSIGQIPFRSSPDGRRGKLAHVRARIGGLWRFADLLPLSRGVCCFLITWVLPR